MITGKINLTKLVPSAIVKRKNKEGKEIQCMLIPIEENNLFLSDKGNVFLDIRFEDIPEDKRKGDDCYFISQSVGSEKYKEMKAAGYYPPSLGYAKIWEPSGSGEVDNVPVVNEEDDLPF